VLKALPGYKAHKVLSVSKALKELPEYKALKV
jgi:hypothetical protein